MKKRIKKIMICIMVAVLVLTAMPMNSFAAEPTIVKSGKCGENVTYTLDSDGLLTISGEGEMENYEWVDSPFYENSSIKSIVINKGVTSISYGAFEYCSGLTNVTIGNSVKSIGEYAFLDCTGLTSITIPNSVTSIGDWAFSGCSGLTSITIPNSVKSIGEYAFLDCTGLTSITIGNSVTSIGESAFLGCTGLTSITVDKNNKVYDSRNNCNAIIETATNTLLYGCKNTVIPDSVTSIGDWAFYDCYGLISITIPDSVMSISDDAFRDCTGLTSVTIGNSVTSIGDDAFRDCTGLTSITVDKNNKVYDSRNNCNAIIETATNTLLYGCKNTVMPSSITSIGEYAFRGCTGLTSITIPNSVTSIGDWAFDGCTGLKSITVNKNNKVYDSRNNCNAIIETATNTLICGCKNTVIPDSVTGIGDSAFHDCTGLTSITIPNSVTSIRHGAFRGCTGLINITIPNSVTSIGDMAFAGSGLKEIIIPDKVKNLDHPLLGCSNLESIKIGSGIEYIDWTTFYSCPAIKYIEVSKNNRFYDSRNNCNGIIETATNKLIYGCPNTKIPGSVKSIGICAYCDCLGLTDIVIPEGIERIDDGISYDPLPDCVFRGCTNLKSVAIPESMKYIGTYALGGYYHPNLKDIYYAGSKEQWNRIEFGFGNHFENVTIHYNWSPCEESNINLNGKDYSVIMDYGDAFSGDVELNISKADSGNFEIPLNPFLSLNINAVSGCKEVQPDKPITLMFEKSMFNCGVDELTIFHFPDGKTPETFNNRKFDSAYHITEKELNGKTYYCITVSSLSPFIFTDGTGDVNSDGTVNSSDALTVLQHSVGKITLTDNTFTRADVDRNKTVNSADALKILQFSVGQINTF